MNSVFSVLMVAIVALSISISGQQVARPTVELTATTVPPNLRPHSVVEVYKGLQTTPKGEFETTAEYEARTKARPQPTRYFFRLEKSSAGPYVTYDADKELFDVAIVEDAGATVGAKLDRSFRAIHIIDESSSTSYPAQNAFGATTTVTQTYTSRFGLVFSNKPPNKASSPVVRHYFLPSSRRDAPALKSALEMYVVCEPYAGSGPPTLGGSFGATSATFRSPHAGEVVYAYVRVNLISLWIVDGWTRKILLKVDDYE